MPTSDLRRLLSVLRAHCPQLSLTSVEALLVLAEEPRTAAELSSALGTQNGQTMRACWPFLTRVTNGDRQVVEAQLPLMKRTKAPRKAPVYQLSENGKRLLRECGILP